MLFMNNPEPVLYLLEKSLLSQETKKSIFSQKSKEKL